MKLPIVLFENTLEWECNDHLRYRLVAFETTYGFNGIDFRSEKWVGIDAMGVDQWQELPTTEGSLYNAAIGQFLLNQLKTTNND